MQMSIVFYGTSDYCIPILETLYKNYNLKLVITRPDKLIGRKKVLTPSATKIWAIEHNVPTLTPETLKKGTRDRDLIMEQFSNLTIDLAVVSDYGLIIPEAIFNQPKLGTLNVHFSKLPDLRGPSPVQFTLLRGDSETWVTIFKLENPPELEIKMDSGPILWQKSYPNSPDDTTGTLYPRLFKEAATELPTIIKFYESHKAQKTMQNHQLATYCRFLTKQDGFIEWNTLQKAVRGEILELSNFPKIQQEAIATKNTPLQLTPINLINFVYSFHRAVTPWPGMWTIKDGKRMLVRKCHLEEDKLVLDEIQFEGKNPFKTGSNSYEFK